MSEIEVLATSLESEVDQHLRDPAAHPLRTLGQGEISVVIAYPAEDSVGAFKRLPPFPDRARAEAYRAQVDAYSSALEAAGCAVVQTDGIIVPAAQDGFALYLQQEIFAPETLASNILKAADPDPEHPVLTAILDTVAAATTERLAIDAQVSNWVWIDDTPQQIDISTPFMRDDKGNDVLDTFVILLPYPAMFRPLLRKFVVPDILANYHDIRGCFIDLIGNLNREQMPQWIPAAIDAANARQIGDPITEDEVQKLYEKDAATYESIYRLKLLNSWWMRKIRRGVYPFILQEPEER